MDNAGKLENLNDLVIGSRVTFTESSPGVVNEIWGNPVKDGMDGNTVECRLCIIHDNGNESYHTFRHDGRSHHKANMDIVSVTLPDSENAHPPAQAIDVGSGEWSGEGLPPVGTVCEWSANGNMFRSIEVLFINEEAVFFKSLKQDPKYMWQDLSLENYFRPILSERDKVIESALVLLYGSIKCIHEDDRRKIENLYDAGHLTLPED